VNRLRLAGTSVALVAVVGLVYWEFQSDDPVGYLPPDGVAEERVNYDAFDHRNDPPPVPDDAPTLMLPRIDLGQLRDSPMKLDLQLSHPAAGSAIWVEGEILHTHDKSLGAVISLSFFEEDAPLQDYRVGGSAFISGWARTADGDFGRIYKYRISGYLPETPGRHNVIIMVHHENLDPDFKRLPFSEWMQFTEVGRGSVTILRE